MIVRNQPEEPVNSFQTGTFHMKGQRRRETGTSWAYQNTAGSTLGEATFTHNLYRTHAGWKITVLTQHDSD
ncbi:MAG: hypothetical protein WCT47_09495 [Betaproteobacteria bacterium]